MEPVLFYGVPAGCSLASIIALEWLGEPYRLCRIEMLRHPWPEGYRQFNPRSKTPALLLETGDCLTESSAILQHVAARGIDAGLGFRQGIPAFDRLCEMLSYLTTDFFASFGLLWKAYEVQGVGERERQQWREEGTALVKQQLHHVERMLEGRTWLLGGHRPTVADAYLFAVARWAEFHQVPDLRTAFPALASYRARLLEEPAVRFAMAVEEGDLSIRTAACRGHVALDELAVR